MPATTGAVKMGSSHGISPVKADATPLCFLPEYRTRPHAWVKLWKHHAAQPEANKLNETARRLGDRYRFTLRGTIEIPGKGAMETWFLDGLAEGAAEAPGDPAGP